MTELRIFAHAPNRRSLVRPGRPQPVVPIVESTPEVTETLPVESILLEILALAPEPGETIEVAYRRKEHALADVLARLSRDDAALLHRRLLDPQADDVLAQRFQRLVVERRTRLLAILADVPRRRAR